MPPTLHPRPELTLPQVFDYAVGLLCDQQEVENPNIGELYAFAALVFGVDAGELEQEVRRFVVENEKARQAAAGG